MNSTQSTSPATISTAINAAYSTGLAPEGPNSRKRCAPPVRVGIWKLAPLQPPPEESSPARNPTNASLAHWPARNGWMSCCLVCWKAGLMASTAEVGTHVPRNQTRAPARYCELAAGSRESGLKDHRRHLDC